MTRIVHLAVAVSLLLTARIALAGGDGVLPVGPFEGDFDETFEDVFGGFYPELEIFIGEPTVQGGEANGLLIPAAVTTFSSFMGSTVVAHSGAQFSHMTSPIEFVFFTPVRQFGGYFATNGGEDGGTVEFFDDKGDLIDTAPLDVTFQQGIAPYTWNGWVSDLPFSRVRISTNGALKGFLGVDDMQMSFVPTPGAAMVLALAGLSRVRRRRR